VEAGGYIPAVDDLVTPDIPYASFCRYLELAGGLNVTLDKEIRCRPPAAGTGGVPS